MYPNWISTKFICSDVTTQLIFSSQCVAIASYIFGCRLQIHPKNAVSTIFICSDVTTQRKFTLEIHPKNSISNQFNLFWLHHPMKIFYLMCGFRYMSILRRITNASPLPNSCVLTYHRMKIFFSMCGTRYWSLCYKAAHKSIPIESLPNSFVLTSPPNENFLLNVWQ